ncbi:MAG: TlpA disulfide reductase family protein [Planctomycetota bacterium]
MKTYRLTLLATAFLALAAIPVYYTLGEDEVTIDKINFGTLWMGEEITKEDLSDHVVGVEFWGKWCGPCRAAMPHLVNWYKKYSPNGFILLGLHSTKQETKEEVIAFCKQNKITFNIYDRGSISGVDVSGIPHFTLFDHTGKMVYDGHPMEAAAEKALSEAMKNAPDWLVGEGPYKKLKALAEKIKERKGLGGVLKTIKEKHLNSQDPDEKAEAEKLLERLTRYGNKLLQKADGLKTTEPLKSHNLYQETSKLFKGDEIGDNADNALKDLKEDKTFQDNLKADKELSEMIPDIEKLKACGKCGTFNKECEACKKKNASLEALIQKAKGILKKYPDSPAAAKVKELLPVEQK